jgi:hypothetical protein
MSVAFLTEKEKIRHQELFKVEGRVGIGPGFLDEEMLPHLDRLNALEGICTVQSCTGHIKDNTLKREEGPGCLWLRLSRDMRDSFEENLSVLEEQFKKQFEGILYANFWAEMLYGRQYVEVPGEERPVLALSFPGKNLSEQAFETSMKIIVDFFEGLS